MDAEALRLILSDEAYELTRTGEGRGVLADAMSDIGRDDLAFSLRNVVIDLSGEDPKEDGVYFVYRRGDGYWWSDWYDFEYQARTGDKYRSSVPHLELANASRGCIRFIRLGWEKMIGVPEGAAVNETHLGDGHPENLVSVGVELSWSYGKFRGMEKTHYGKCRK